MINRQEETVMLPSAAGELELLITPANESAQTHATAIICHPNPMQGGTMNNKVVTTLMWVFRDLGLRTIRFNFRGVGKSTGAHDRGQGEVQDLITIMDWVKKTSPDQAIWLAGFSFGAAVAIRGATLRPVAQLVTIAPPVSRFDLSDLSPITCPWVMVQGEQDDVVLPQEVYDWIETIDSKPELIRFPQAGHFFHGQLVQLRERLVERLSK